MSNAKLEFFRFQLQHSSNVVKNFRQFMLENGKCKNSDSDMEIFGNLYKYFMEAPMDDFAKNDRQQKCMTVIMNPDINHCFDQRPEPQFPSCIISGVVNGGAYGKERILSDLGNKDSADNIQNNQPVLQYFYVFVCLPLDHHEGFIMVHSEGSESLTSFLRNYVAHLFSVGEYQKPMMVKYAPQSFQNEVRNGGNVRSLIFKRTILNPQIEEGEPLRDILSRYDISITVKPMGNVSMQDATRVKEFLDEQMYGSSSNSYRLSDFESCKLNVRNAETKSSQQFEWNDRENDFALVVYLNDRIEMNEDGSMNFHNLNTYCHTLFKETIKPEIRPDLYV